MIPRYARPMIGWAHDATVLDCGCVRTGIVWHPCEQHGAELADELSDVRDD